MEYRRLTKAELQELEAEFVQFLASNTIPAAEWNTIKSNTPDKAEGLIEIFSDIVFDRVLNKIVYAEQFLPKEVRLFKFSKNNVYQIIVRSENPGGPDIGNMLKLTEAMNCREAKNQLGFYRAQKEYSKNREKEIFEILNPETKPTEGKLFEYFDEVMKA